MLIEVMLVTFDVVVIYVTQPASAQNKPVRPKVTCIIKRHKCLEFSVQKTDHVLLQSKELKVLELDSIIPKEMLDAKCIRELLCTHSILETRPRELKKGL